MTGWIVLAILFVVISCWAVLLVAQVQVSKDEQEEERTVDLVQRLRDKGGL